LLSFNGILSTDILIRVLSSYLVLVGLILLSQILEKLWPLITGKKPTEREMRMFIGIEDSAIANIMTSIDESKYLN
jgi:hypothetical protein